MIGICSLERLEGVLYYKIKRDYSTRKAELFALVPEIARRMCGYGNSEEDCWDRAVAALVECNRLGFPTNATKDEAEKIQLTKVAVMSERDKWYEEQRAVVDIKAEVEHV